MSYEVVSLGQLSQIENETIFGTALIATGMTRLQFQARLRPRTTGIATSCLD